MSILDWLLLPGAILGYASLFLLITSSLKHLTQSEQAAIDYQEKIEELDRQKKQFDEALRSIYTNLSDEQFHQIILERSWARESGLR